VPRQRVAAALRDVFAQARDSLDGRACEALAVSFARLNDEPRVSSLLQGLVSKGTAARAEVLAKVAQSFLASKNLDATLGYLQRTLSAAPLPAEVTASLREAAVSAARLSCADDCLSGDDDPLSAERGPRPRTWDVLEFLGGAKAAATPEAFVPLLEWAARQEPCEVKFAAQAEQMLRALVARAATAGSSQLPMGAYDALVRAHASASGDQEKAFACFDELVQGIDNSRYPTEGSLVGMISSCVGAKNSDLAVHVLSWARKARRCTLPVFSATVKVLAAAKQPERICDVFKEATADGFEPDDAIYGQLIKFAVQAGKLDLARELFGKAGNPDAQNYMSLIRACGQEGNVPKALEMLWELRDHGEEDTSSFNSALDVCVSCGDQKAAAEVFDAMKASGHVDVVSYNILMKQYLGGSRSFAGVDALLKDMDAAGFAPNVATYNALLGDALAIGDFDQAWRVIDIMESGPGVDVYTISILFKGYKGRHRSLDGSSFDRALDLIRKYNVKVDEVLVNVALEACVTLRDPARLSSTLASFRQSGWTLPKQCAMHTYATLIKAYGQTRQLNQAWNLWTEVTERKGLTPNEHLYSQMIDALVTNDRLDDALQLFEEMKRTHAGRMDSQGLAVAYAMIIKGYAQRKECAKALELYDQMQEHGALLGLVVFNSLIDACSRVGSMDSAARLFTDMVAADCVPDLITYSTLIKGYCIRGELDQAMELFSLMRKKGIKPDAIVFNSLLDGCAKKQMPTLCEQVIADMVEAGVAPSNYSASILIKLYGRCRDLDTALKIMEEMPKKYGFRPNTAVFTCLMSSCIGNNRLDLAMDLRLRMLEERVHLDEKTYSTLLRGALRANSVDRCVTLVDAALKEGGRRLLDEELVQSVVALLQKRRGAWDEHGVELLTRLRQAGVSVRCSPNQQDCGYQGQGYQGGNRQGSNYQGGNRQGGNYQGGGDYPRDGAAGGAGPQQRRGPQQRSSY